MRISEYSTGNSTVRLAFADGHSFYITEDSANRITASLVANSILSLLGDLNFKNDLNWLKAKLSWADTEEIEESYIFLQELGAIRYSIDGKPIAAEINRFSVTKNAEAQVMKNYLFISELSQLIAKQPEIVNYTQVGTNLWNEETYYYFIENFQKLVRDCNDRAESVVGNDMVVGISMQVTEVSRPEPKGKKS